VFAALGVVVSKAAELAPERAADCESIAAVEGSKEEVLYIIYGSACV
jgi:hypothetical protein